VRSILAVAALILTISLAHAEDTPTRPDIWTLKLGTSASALPCDAFVDYACGSNGGPPQQLLTGWSDYDKCRPEPNGLHEVYFRYDDELPSDSVETDIAGFERHTQHTTGTAQQRLDPGDQLGHGEGLSQIVVGPRIEPGNPIFDRIPCRQDQDREGLSNLPCSGQDRETVTVRQAQIEDCRVVVDELERGARIGGRARDVHGKAHIA
jgi:hypothetical protein